MFHTQSPRMAVRSYQATGAAHAHEHAQAVLPLVGSMDLSVGDRRGRVSGDMGVMIPAGVLHRFGAEAPNRFLVLDFESVGAVGGFFALDPGICHLLRYVDGLTSRARLAPDVELHATALLADAVRSRLPERPRHTSEVRRALAFVQQRFAAPLCVADIAAAAGLSPSHLHAEFRRQLGKSPARHLADVRLAAAMDLLRHSDEPIGQIALACGYCEQSALNRALRQRLDVTPRALRRSQAAPNPP